MIFLVWVNPLLGLGLMVPAKANWTECVFLMAGCPNGLTAPNLTLRGITLTTVLLSCTLNALIGALNLLRFMMDG